MSTSKAVVLAVILALFTGISRCQCPANCTCSRTAVYCVRLQLSTIPFAPPETTDLDLTENLITSLSADAFQALPNLLTLFLESNRLRNISRATFRGLIKLQSLYLSSNELESIDDGVFEEIPDLRHLNLGRNWISNISRVSFKGLTQVHSLYLSSNRLGTIPRAVLSDLPQLKTLYLADNPIVCDCQLRWLIETAQASEFYLYGVCSKPALLNGRDIMRVTQADLNCSTQTNEASTSQAHVYIGIGLGAVVLVVTAAVIILRRRRPNTPSLPMEDPALTPIDAGRGNQTLAEGIQMGSLQSNVPQERKPLEARSMVN